MACTSWGWWENPRAREQNATSTTQADAGGMTEEMKIVCARAQCSLSSPASPKINGDPRFDTLEVGNARVARRSPLGSFDGSSKHSHQTTVRRRAVMVAQSSPWFRIQSTKSVGLNRQTSLKARLLRCQISQERGEISIPSLSRHGSWDNGRPLEHPRNSCHRVIDWWSIKAIGWSFLES